MCLCQRGLNWLSPKLKWVLAIKVRVHERCPVQKDKAGIMSSDQDRELHIKCSNLPLALIMWFWSSPSASRNIWGLLFAVGYLCVPFCMGVLLKSKYWPNMRIVTEWCLYGNEYFAILFMCSFKNFSAGRFLFKVCLPICSFSVSDLSLILKNCLE